MEKRTALAFQKLNVECKTVRYEGTWHIYEMETWEEDYFNMEVQAYIKVDSRGMGMTSVILL